MEAPCRGALQPFSMHPRDFWDRGKKVAWSQVRTEVPSLVRPFTCIPEF